MPRHTDDSKRQQKMIENELNIHRSLKNTYIVEFIDFFYLRSYAFIILSFCDNDSLEKYVREARINLTKKDYAHFVMQILKGVVYMHSKNVIHRDLKADNILLDNKLRVKICDFGFAILADGPRLQSNKICGTWTHIAPEVFQGMKPSFASDVWAVGVLTYKLFFNKFPFVKEGSMTIDDCVIKMNYR